MSALLELRMGDNWEEAPSPRDGGVELCAVVQKGPVGAEKVCISAVVAHKNRHIVCALT